MDVWKDQVLQSKRQAIINKIIVTKYVGKEKMAGKKFKSICELLKEVGAEVGGTHLNYEGYQIYLSLISSRLDEISRAEIEDSRFGCMSSETSDEHSHASRKTFFFQNCC